MNEVFSATLKSPSSIEVQSFSPNVVLTAHAHFAFDHFLYMRFGLSVVFIEGDKRYYRSSVEPENTTKYSYSISGKTYHRQCALIINMPSLDSVYIIAHSTATLLSDAFLTSTIRIVVMQLKKANGASK